MKWPKADEMPIRNSTTPVVLQGFARGYRTSAIQLPEQHRRAESPGHPEANAVNDGLQFVHVGRPDLRRHRDDAHDQEGTAQPRWLGQFSSRSLLQSGRRVDSGLRRTSTACHACCDRTAASPARSVGRHRADPGRSQKSLSLQDSRRHLPARWPQLCTHRYTVLSE